MPHRRSLTKVSVIAPDLAGGGTTRVYLVSSVLQKLGYEVEVIGCQFGPQIYPTPSSNLPVSAIPSGPLPGFAKSAFQLLRAIQGDWVYAIKPRLTSFGAALLKQLLSHRPLLLDIDDWELSWFGGDRQCYRPGLKQAARDILKPDGALRDPEHHFYLEQMERLIQRADATTVSTQFLQNRFGGHYLPNGKDTDIFDPALFDPQMSRQKYGLSDYRILMFPGTARPHKGLEDMLAALDQLNQSDLRLVIVGGRKPDGYEDDLLKRWQRWLIKLPTFPVNQMAEVVSAAHVVVVPQRDSPTAQAQFPLKLTDGMAMAKPILATQVGDIPEILGGAGYLVEPSAPEQLADQLKLIFEHPVAAHERGLEARSRCLEHYSVKAMAEKLSDVIAEL